MELCPRCGATMKRITPNHVKACSIPTPQELAQSFIDEPCVTTKTLADKCNVHRDFMEARLLLGGIPAVVQANRGHILRRMSWGKIQNETARIPPGMRQCPYCEILIPANHSMCVHCAIQVQKRKPN